MPERQTVERARRDKRQGKSASTQAGEFVREEMHHIRQGKHGAASAKQAIAIGLSKARRAGVNLRPPRRGKVSDKTRRSAAVPRARTAKASGMRLFPEPSPRLDQKLCSTKAAPPLPTAHCPARRGAPPENVVKQIAAQPRAKQPTLAPDGCRESPSCNV
jgi:hypothetical protein